MVKVLIYSSRELYDTSSFEGRAEADLIAYRIDDYDCAVVKIDLLKYLVMWDWYIFCSLCKASHRETRKTEFEMEMKA